MERSYSKLLDCRRESHLPHINLQNEPADTAESTRCLFRSLLPETLLECLLVLQRRVRVCAGGVASIAGSRMRRGEVPEVGGQQAVLCRDGGAYFASNREPSSHRTRIALTEKRDKLGTMLNYAKCDLRLRVKHSGCSITRSIAGILRCPSF